MRFERSATGVPQPLRMKKLMFSSRSGVATVTVTIFSIVASNGIALAARPAHRGERVAIQRLAYRECQGEPHCQKSRVTISTVNPRFGDGGAFSDGFGGILAHKSHGRWHVRDTFPSGAMPCSRWLRDAPRAVLHDLDIEGLSNRYPNGGPC